MISALVSFLGGSVFRMIWGEASAYLNKRQDHRHETEMLKVQAELEQAKHGRDLEQMTTAFDEFSKKKLDTLLTTLTDAQGELGKDYTKNQAIMDSKGAIDNLFTKYKQEALPQIVAQGAQGGVYNSTALQGLADNAFAATVAKGAELQQQTIKDYAAIGQTQQNLGIEAILAALGLEAKAFGTSAATGKSSTDTQSEGTQTTNSVTTQKGKSSGMGAQLNLG